MFDTFVSPSKKYADVIIPWAQGENTVAIDLIVQHIRTKLGQNDLRRIYPNLIVLPPNFQIRGMHTIIRNHACNRSDFVFYSDRLIRLVVEHALGHLPFKNEVVRTPNGDAYNGVSFSKKICGVSIIRSGEAMENALRACCKGIKIGKVLIERRDHDGHPRPAHRGRERRHRVERRRLLYSVAPRPADPFSGWLFHNKRRGFPVGLARHLRRTRRTSRIGTCCCWTPFF